MDVVVTENMFGDILTTKLGIGWFDGNAAIRKPGRREPRVVRTDSRLSTGYCRKGIANPTGTILSAAMLLRHSLATGKLKLVH